MLSEEEMTKAMTHDEPRLMMEVSTVLLRNVMTHVIRALEHHCEDVMFDADDETALQYAREFLRAVNRTVRSTPTHPAHPDC